MGIPKALRSTAWRVCSHAGLGSRWPPDYYNQLLAVVAGEAQLIMLGQCKRLLQLMNKQSVLNTVRTKRLDVACKSIHRTMQRRPCKQPSLLLQRVLWCCITPQYFARSSSCHLLSSRVLVWHAWLQITSLLAVWPQTSAVAALPSAVAAPAVDTMSPMLQANSTTMMHPAFHKRRVL